MSLKGLWHICISTAASEIRYDRNPIIHEAFLKIACILDAWNMLKCSFC